MTSMTPHSRWLLLLLLHALLLACTATTQSPTPSPTPPAPIPSPSSTVEAAMQITDFPGAESVSVVAPEDGRVYVALGQEGALFVAHSADGGQHFSTPVRASGESHAVVMSVEHPAIVADARGSVAVSWLEPVSHEESQLWYARSEDGGATFSPPQLVSRATHVETTMVRLTGDEVGNPVIAWLQGGTLRLARSPDHGATFPLNEVVDPQVCDCCQPQPLVRGEQVLVAYRNLEKTREGDQRIIYVARSEDGGVTFAKPVPASDTPWYFNACPISGPAMVADGERLYVSWMDGRNDAQGDLSRADIWLAVSEDGGQSFSENVRVNPTEGDFHNLPSLALGAEGRLHVAWEAREAARQVIYHARSEDGGQRFSVPRVVASSAGATQRGPSNASLAVRAGRVYVAWVDGAGAHLAVWEE